MFFSAGGPPNYQPQQPPDSSGQGFSGMSPPPMAPPPNGPPPPGMQPPPGMAPPPGMMPPPGGGGRRISGGLKAIAIISIVFGSLCVICTPVALINNQMQRQQMQTGQFRTAGPMGASMEHDMKLLMEHDNPTWNMISSVISFGLGLCLLISGIGTLSLKPWAATLAKVYGWASVGLWIVSAVMMAMMFSQVVPELKTDILKYSIWAGACAIPIGLTYPIIVLYFYGKQSTKEQFANGGLPSPGYGPPGMGQPPYPPGPPQQY